MDADLQMMVCTAGHVDHGKTSLVKLLTGCSTDRLKEEQERGLTIELGFAPCLLAGETCIGIVDVPGHEKFVRNMVAGVSGIDMAVLVVAADDGVMPQTVEHLQIMELVGVRHGVVALTKIDLASPGRVTEVEAQLRELLAGTFLEGARICTLSSETFDGFFAFYEVLVEEVRALERRRSDHVFRMPILSTFSSEGFGSVVTGIPVDGQVEVGDQLELVPGGERGRVRGLQRFLRDAEQGGFGQCLALNIPDFGKLQPVRGQVLCVPGHLEAARSFLLRVKVVADASKPLRNAEEVLFHTGTSEERGKLYLLEEKTLPASASGLAQIVLAKPVAAAPHDRYILRRSSPARTVAGGDVLSVEPGAQKVRRKQALARSRDLLDSFAGVERSSPEWLEKEVDLFLRRAGTASRTTEEISRGTLLGVPAVEQALSRLVESGALLRLSADCHLAVDAYRSCLAEAASRVARAASNRSELDLGVSDLRRGLDWPLPLWKRIEDDLERDGLVARKGDRLLLVGAVRELDDGLAEDDRALAARLLELYESTGFRSPRPDELPERLKAPPEQVERLLGFLCAKEQLFRLAKNVVLSRSRLREAQRIVVEEIERNGLLDSADFKRHIDSTRKYALAILDWLDGRQVLVRRGNHRSLAADYRSRLLEPDPRA